MGSPVRREWGFFLLAFENQCDENSSAEDADWADLRGFLSRLWRDSPNLPWSKSAKNALTPLAHLPTLFAQNPELTLSALPEIRITL